VSYDIQASQVTPPGAGTAVATSTTSTAATDLSAYEGRWVVIIPSAKTHIRFGASNVGAAVVADVWIPADVAAYFWIPKSGTRSFFRAILPVGAAAATLSYADASDGH
jgi:hypothetical protein